MSELAVSHDGGQVLVSSGSTIVADYRVDTQVAPVDAPKPYFHPLRTLGGVAITGFGPEDHPWHHGLAFAFPRVGEHNLWGGGTYLSPDEGYQVLDDHGAIEHDSWQTVEAEGGVVTIAHRVRWRGRNKSTLMIEERSWSLRRSGDALVIDLATSLENATGASIALATPAQRGRPDGGYGGLFLRLGPDFAAEALFGGEAPVLESGHESRTLVVHGRTAGGEAVTLGLSFLPGSPGAQKWLYRFEPFSAIGWAVAYDDGLELTADASLAFAHRLVLIDGHTHHDVVESLL